MNKKEHEFFHGIESVLTKTPSKLIWYVPMIINGLIFTFILWISLSEVDVITNAMGKIIPSTRMQVIQPKETGVVENIFVKKGDKVVKGQKLIGLRKDIEQIEYTLLEKKFHLLTGKKMALENFDSFLTKGVFKKIRSDEVPKEFLKEENRLLESKINSYRTEKTSLQSKVDSTNHEKSILEKEIEKSEKLLPFYTKNVEQIEALNKDGLESGAFLDEKKKELIEKEGELDIMKSKLKKLQSDIDISFYELEQLEKTTKKETLQELRDVDSELSQVFSELSKMKHTLKQKIVVSPVNGVVHNLTAYTIGKVIQQGEIVMQIVPDNTPLEVEANILNKDIGFIKVGQSVKVKIDSFPFT
ncbi:MAG: HlyD family type I secretion periplasmic adaptor subunit, partial [Campylobacterales bacterium]|nr:HlyD family type I secretion periplasmic adaptor subunit [Campylobacterales bacterium]